MPAPAMSARSDPGRGGAAPSQPWTPDRGYALILAPPCVFLLLFFLWPLLTVVVRGTWGQYVEVFSRPTYVKVLFYTLQVAASTTVLCLLISYPVAAVVARLRGSLLHLCLAMILLPFWTSTVIRTYAWMVLFQRKGVLNGALINLGLIEQPLELMHNSIGVHIGMVHVLLPFMILPLLSSLRTIDPTYMRAAEVLGANPIRAFLHVYLPLSMPDITAGVALVFISALGFFVTPALLGSERDMMIAILIEQQVNITVNWELASALATLLLAVTVALYLLYERLARAGGSAGAWS
jgi:ABC-type spermidine/putrescine transport system permease subunit I